MVVLRLPSVQIWPEVMAGCHLKKSNTVTAVTYHENTAILMLSILFVRETMFTIYLYTVYKINAFCYYFKKWLYVCNRNTRNTVV